MDSGNSTGAVDLGRGAAVVGCGSPDVALIPEGVTVIRVEDVRSPPASVRELAQYPLNQDDQSLLSLSGEASAQV